MEAAEYMKRKAVLEEPLERWEQFDWNLDAEIEAFLYRIGHTHYVISDVRDILSDIVKDTDDTVLATVISECLAAVLEAPDIVHHQILEELLDPSLGLKDYFFKYFIEIII